MEDISKILFTHLVTIDLINTNLITIDHTYCRNIDDYNNKINKLQEYLNQLDIIGKFIFGLIGCEQDVEYVSEVMIIIFTTVYDKTLNRINNAKRKRGLLQCLIK